MVLENTYKIDKSLVRLILKRKKAQITNIKIEKGNITTDLSDIEKTVEGYYEQFYGSTFENLDEMNTFL